jgi:hypothetical protein
MKMKTLESRIIESITKGNVGIESLISDIQRTSRREKEIELLKENGLNAESPVEGHFCTYGGTKYIDSHSEMWRKLECVNSDFSDLQIKRVVTGLCNLGIMKKCGSSKNQIRMGNYYIKLITEI